MQLTTTSKLGGSIRGIALSLVGICSALSLGLAVLAIHPLGVAVSPSATDYIPQQEQVFEARFARPLEEMPETIVTPERTFTRYRLGEHYYFFSSGRLVLVSKEELPKLRGLVATGRETAGW